MWSSACPSDTSVLRRVWVILMPRIPNPSKNFDELFITHNGNFQVSRPIPWWGRAELGGTS